MVTFAPKNADEIGLMILANEAVRQLDEARSITSTPLATQKGRVESQFPRARISNSAKLPKKHPASSTNSTPIIPRQRPPSAAIQIPIEPIKKKKIKTPRREIPLPSKPFLPPDSVSYGKHFAAKYNLAQLSSFFSDLHIDRPLSNLQLQLPLSPPPPQFERVQVGDFDIATISRPTAARISLAGKMIVEKFRSRPGAGGGYEMPFDKKPYPGANRAPSGVDFAEYARQLEVEARLVAAEPRLKGFTFAHISRQESTVERLPTLFVDGVGRAFAVRAPMSESARRSALEVELDNEISMSTTRGTKAYIRPAAKDYGRGNYDCRFASLNNEQGNPPGYCPAFKTQPSAWKRLFETNSFSSFRHSASETLRTFFPSLYEEHRQLAKAFSEYALNPLFGAFASICINKGRVATIPHRDASNRGPGLCGVIPFGRFDSSRSGWLILWEARTVIEVASGDVCLFPSAILTHSNTAIHPDDDRNSLAFWTGASLFLLVDMKGRSKNDMSLEEEREYFARAPTNWKAAWDKFPIV